MDCDFERTLSNGNAGFPEFIETIESYLEGAEVPPDIAMKAMIALDEILSNALKYGNETSIPSITVGISLTAGELIAEVRDDGPPFDPLSIPAPDTSLSVEDRSIGGLGIHIVRELMDRVSYTYDGNFNRLLFAKTLSV